MSTAPTPTSVNSSRLVLPVTTALAVVASAWSCSWYLRGALADEAQTFKDAHQATNSEVRAANVELRHEVEKLRLEVTRDIRDLTTTVDLGVSTEQARAWIALMRANLAAIDPKLSGAIPDLPARDARR
jgi:hypothetical protein